MKVQNIEGNIVLSTFVIVILVADVMCLIVSILSQYINSKNFNTPSTKKSHLKI